MKILLFQDAKGYGIATAKGTGLHTVVNLAVLKLKEKGDLVSWTNKGPGQHADALLAQLNFSGPEIIFANFWDFFKNHLAPNSLKVSRLGDGVRLR